MKLFEFKPKLVSCLKNYSKETFMADLMAGIIVGIVALPLAIAFGIASGVSPEKGIITAIIAGFIISLLGGSKVQIGGPTGAFIVIIYGIIQQYGEAGLIVATLMAGVLLVLLGVFKLGAVIKFIPYPIIVGFTSGIAVTIFTTQIADIFGLSFGDEKVPGDFVGKWLIYFRHFDTINWWNTIVSIVSIIIIAITPRSSQRRFPGSLIAIIVVTIAVYLMKTYGGIDLHRHHWRPFYHSVTVAGCSSARIKLGSYQEFISGCHHHCCTGSHRISVVCCRSRWCHW